MTAILLAPLLIPADARLIRLVGGLSAAVFAFKLFDYFVGLRRGRRLDRAAYISTLTNALVLVERKPARRMTGDPARAARTWLHLLIAVTMLVPVIRFNWAAQPFLLQAAIKNVLVFLVAVHGVQAILELIRSAGVAIADFVDAPWRARTPAEFWRRYNQPVDQFFFENVFRPTGGLRAPGRMILLIFAVSGVLHEYIFALATGQVRGFQIAFFLIQGVATAATFRFAPRGRLAIAATLATLAFNILTATLFFASANAVLPLYQNPPAWLAP